VFKNSIVTLSYRTATFLLFTKCSVTYKCA